MKTRISKFLCLSLLQVACSNCMEYKQDYDFGCTKDTVDKMKNMLTLTKLAEKSQVDDCSQNSKSALEEVDISTVKLFGASIRKKINSKIKSIESKKDIFEAKRLKSEIKSRRCGTQNFLSSRDSDWLDSKITELESFINSLSNKTESKDEEIGQEANLYSNKIEATEERAWEKDSHRAILVEITEKQETANENTETIESKLQTAELINFDKKQEESLSTRASQDDKVPVTELEMVVVEGPQNQANDNNNLDLNNNNNADVAQSDLSQIKIAPEFANVTDLKASINVATKLNEENDKIISDMKIEDLEQALKNLEQNNQNAQEKLENAEKILEDLKAQKVDEKELEKFEKQISDLKLKLKEQKNKATTIASRYCTLV